LLEQFLMVAGAHFLALLSPGPDFFLIVRTALLHGWQRASGISVGVAMGNGLFIALAWAGLSAIAPGSAAFLLLQVGGGLYLGWLGWRLLRSPGTAIATDVDNESVPRPSWWHGLRMGFISALLNPKNALFYASLFSLLTETDRTVQALYGAWMVCAVLGWDLLIAVGAGHRRVVERFARHLGYIERATGLLLLLIAVGVAVQIGIAG
jgi:threonine/homoserine/homoserine lactone efflux protein